MQQSALIDFSVEITMLSLVVGYGSIGSRHAEVLQTLGCQAHIVTKQTLSTYATYQTVTEALKQNVFDLIVIANSTNLHYETLNIIVDSNHSSTILVEKPLFSHAELPLMCPKTPVFVAYNLRFHSLLQKAKLFLKDDPPVSLSVYAGSYLPEWRKNRDYRTSYSAQKENGGGVLRDLSHELDYVLWLCGSCISVTAHGGTVSTLEITSDDHYSILMNCEKCAHVSIELDYLNRVPTRTVTVHTRKHNTIVLDLIRGDFILNGDIIFSEQEPIKKTYQKQIEAILSHKTEHICTYDEGIAVMKLMAAIEEASQNKRWVLL